MSLENVEVVRRQVEALNKGDLIELLQRLDLDVEWRDREDDPSPSVHRGHDGVRAMLADTAEHFAKLRLEPTAFIDVGDCVLSVHLVGRGRASGAPIEGDEVHLYRLRAGKITEVREYREQAEALEALAPDRNRR